MRHLYRHILTIICLLFLTACSRPYRGPFDVPNVQLDKQDAVSLIAFGSCCDAGKPVPAFGAIARMNPDVMIFLGDNVYADTTNEQELIASYRELASNVDFQYLAKACPMLAIWDDHDYGINDGGVEHPTKAMSQRVFLDFWNIPLDSPRRFRKGIYDAMIVGPEGKRVQFILLDTRYHRGPLLKNPEKQPNGVGPYIRNDDPAVPLLGEDQWGWLKIQLMKPADLRIIASSIQVIAEDHNWESWSMLPAERARLFMLIRDTKANGILFISGDRHQAEISKLDFHADFYEFYDVTSSSFNKAGLPNDERNQYRLGKRLPSENFGLITINWNASPPMIDLQVFDPAGNVKIGHTLKLSDLSSASK